MSLEELEVLMDEFVGTLDSDRDEWFASERSLAERFLGEFSKWLLAREALQSKQVMK